MITPMDIADKWLPVIRWKLSGTLIIGIDSMLLLPILQFDLKTIKMQEKGLNHVKWNFNSILLDFTREIG